MTTEAVDAGEVQRLRDQVTQLSRQVRLHEAWKQTLVERLHKEADDRDYCDEFDQIMDDLNLPRRGRDYTVSVTVTFVHQVQVHARNEDYARQEARDYEDLREEVASELRNGAYFDEIIVGMVEVAE